MATVLGSTAAKDTPREGNVWPIALDALEENVRRARQAIVEGRHAAEDLMSGTTLEVQRHPLRSLALTAGLAGMTGCLFGLVVGWRMFGSE